MQAKKITSFFEFLEQIEKSVAGVELALFRGQAVRKNLLPRIARKNRGIDTTQLEQDMINELRRVAGEHLDHRHDNDWELLVTAQHFGMATRLLDWTSNPLAALWFALSPDNADGAFVYMLNADSLLERNSGKAGPFSIAKTRVFKPRLNNSRIVAQDGWFTAHRFSKTAKAFVALEANKDVKAHLVEFIIQIDAKKGMVEALDRCGINSRTLFPDLEGVCRYLTWKFTSNNSVKKKIKKKIRESASLTA